MAENVERDNAIQNAGAGEHAILQVGDLPGAGNEVDQHEEPVIQVDEPNQGRGPANPGEQFGGGGQEGRAVENDIRPDGLHNEGGLLDGNQFPGGAGGGLEDLNGEGGVAVEGRQEWLRVRRRLRLPGPETVEESIVTNDRPQLTWAQLTARYTRENFDSFFLSDINFSHILAYEVGPDEDLGEAIKTNCKVFLNPEVTYTLNSTVALNIPCYVIGNGASIVVNCHLGFDIRGTQFTPVVPDMHDVVFLNCSFERGEHERGRVRAIRSNRAMVIQGCVFVGFLATCVTVRGGGSIRSCQFLATYVCILNAPGFTAVVKQCIFERCVVCVIAKGKTYVRRCMVLQCHTFVVFANTGGVTDCTAIGPPTTSPLRTIKLCTCMCGHASRLYNIHVVSNRRLPWPIFDRNTFTRMNIYLGNRRGIFHPSCSSFSFCVLNVETAAASRLTLQHCYEGFCFVRRLAQPAANAPGQAFDMTQMLCLCQETHFIPRQRVVDITRRVVPNRRLVSCNTGDYSSEEEDI